MQHYITRYPEEIDALVLDGSVDMSVPLLPYERDLADAQNEVLALSFKECEKTETCRAQFQGSSGPLSLSRIYESVRRMLEKEDASVVVNGESLRFTAYDFEYAASSSVSRPEGRSAFIKALALAHGKRDFSLLMKVANGESLEEKASVAAKKDADEKKSKAEEKSFAGMSSGIFYAFVCNDYGMKEATAEARAEAFRRGGRQHEERRVAIRNALYNELPCAFWPNVRKLANTNETSFPANLPVMVVNATGDANVTSKHGYAVAKKAPLSVLVDVRGGKHIMYGYKKACIDKPVTDFLLAHKLPQTNPILCEESFLKDEAKK